MVDLEFSAKTLPKSVMLWWILNPKEPTSVNFKKNLNIIIKEMHLIMLFHSDLSLLTVWQLNYH